MRLTLRTMLAYLDNVLEPGDADILGQKINESDFASGLVSRIRGVLKKVRMDAPKVDGKGIGNDANTVAEYLDSSLPQDRVGDFERICLESDKHLSEVASCHQILTLVLGQPADVPTELRERVYALADPEQQAKPAKGAARAVAESKAVPPPLVRANGQLARPAPMEVPEYLRAGRSGTLWPAIGIVAAICLLGAFGVWVTGIYESSHPVRQWLQGGPQVVAHVPESDVTPAPASPEPSTPAEPSTSEPEAESTKSSPSVADTAAPSTAVPPSTTTPAEVATTEIPAPLARPSVPDVDPPPAVPPPSAPPKAVAKAADVPPAPTPMPPPTAPESPQVAAAPSIPMAPRNPPAPAVPEEKPLIEVGRYTSDGQILATLNSRDGLWHRKPSRDVLVGGERLIVLPTYRPQLSLPGMQVTFAGLGHVEMAAPGETGNAKMLVDYGRFLVVAVGAAGPKIDLDLAGIQGTATLVDADSSLAIKVSRWLPPGTDPEAFTGMPVVEIFNTGGRVAWQSGMLERVEIPANHVVIYIGADPPELQGPYFAPEWIDAKSISATDRLASLGLEATLDPTKPLNLSLQETTQDRRIEVRALSARCLATLEEFDPIVRELSDNRQYSYWAAEIEALRQAISRSPQTAAQLSAALERLRGNDAKDLYRLLWGYSPEQLEKGAAAQLVRFLEHEQMDIRVLTFHNLIAITGAQEFYRPERPPTQVRAAIQNWKDRLAKGTIAYKFPPSPVEGYKPIPPPATP